jgi:hypothetical protein
MDTFLCYDYKRGPSDRLMTMDDLFAYEALDTRSGWGKNVYYQSWN